MRLYTVILLYPDYIAEDYGQETYQAFITGGEGMDTMTAICEAQLEAGKANKEHKGCAFDFYPLAVFYGHHENLI